MTHSPYTGQPWAMWDEQANEPRTETGAPSPAGGEPGPLSTPNLTPIHDGLPLPGPWSPMAGRALAPGPEALAPANHGL